jgi:cytoskeletal protein CcmA (bactofilin family)
MAMRPSGWRRVVDPGAREAQVKPTAAREPAAPSAAQGVPGAPETEAAAEPSGTFITSDCELEGRLVLDRSIRIDCEFRGRLESAETVTVGSEAAIEASIEARSVIVQGAVVGDVRGTREVVLCPTARLHGSIETPSLVIERGAVFNGETRMYRPEQSAVARAARLPDRERPASAPVEA